uniref:Reverse transcriptase Ty1/copia-type domain-containing protein n=1 Tax=Strongyloides papillosus TaxID=174720 RepID=A0A0N5C0W0_STREA
MSPEDSKKDIELELAQAFKIVKGLPFVKLSGPTNFRQWLNDMKTLCLTIGVDFDDMKKLLSQNKDVILRLLNLYIDSELRNDLLDFTCPIELLEEVREFEEDEIVYMSLPKSIELINSPPIDNVVCKLLKPIYGLRQSSRCWYRTLVDFLTTNANFNVSDFDSCVLFTHNPTLIIIILYVDDIMILSQNIVLIDKIKQRITSRFEAKDYGQIMNTEYIGLEFKVQYDEIFVSQEIRIRKLIDEYSCLNIVPKKNINVSKGEVLESDILDEKQHSNFRKIVGELSYISNLSRPDITYSVNYLQRVLEKPRKCHLSLAINIISYLMKFPNLPLHFKKSTRPPLEAYSDASYASSKDSHSTTGILIMVYGAPVY